MSDVHALDGPGSLIGRSNHLTLVALGISTIVYGLLQSLTVPALPDIAAGLGASDAATSWMIAAFLISAAVATPILGRLGDMFGKERMLLVTLGFVCVGCAVSALAPTISVALVGRVLQGVSGGFLPLSFAIIRDEFPTTRVPSGLAVTSSLLGLGSGVGVLVSGPVAENLGWSWLYWIPLILGLVAAGATWVFVAESPLKTRGRVDVIGGALLAAGLICLLLAVSNLGTWGTFSPRTLALVAAGAVSLGTWVHVELRVDQPLVDMRMMRARGVWTTNVVTLLVGVGMFGAFVLIPEYVHEPAATGYGFGASITVGGLYLLPMTLLLVVVGSQAGRLERRLGARRTLITAVCVSLLMWVFLIVAHTQPWQILVASGLAGAGNGLALAALPILITGNVRQSETGVANGMNNVMRTIGSAIGAQVVAALIDRESIAGLHAERGYVMAFAAGAVALAASLVVSLFIPDHTRTGL
jgi:MFS family permease